MILIALSGALATAQRFSSPVLGYAYDPGARAVRVIAGVPGAAAFEDTSARDIGRAFLPAVRSYAIAEGYESGGLRLVRWPASGMTAASLASAGSQADDVAFSTSGNVAAIYFKDAETLEVWAALPDAPTLVFRTHVEATLRALTVSDDASAVVAVTESGTLLLVEVAAARLIGAGDGYRAAAFLSDSLDVAAADAALDQVVLYRNVTREAHASVLAGASEGVAGPVALAMSADNRKLVVANGRSESILQLDLETRQSVNVACACKPVALHRLQGNAVFRITETFKTDVLFFDGDALEPRVFATSGGNQ